MPNDDIKLYAATLRTDLPSLDIHGRFVYEAADEVAAFISRLIEKNEPAGRIIYGIGTGALREAVLKELRNHPEVATLHEESGSCIIILK